MAAFLFLDRTARSCGEWTAVCREQIRRQDVIDRQNPSPYSCRHLDREAADIIEAPDPEPSDRASFDQVI
jgi:hypothetical protein